MKLAKAKATIEADKAEAAVAHFEAQIQVLVHIFFVLLAALKLPQAQPLLLHPIQMLPLAWLLILPLA